MLRIGLVAVLCSVAIAGARPATAAEAWQALYEAKTYKNAAGGALPYRLMKPEKIEPGTSYPIVLFLHGGGQSGTDNVNQLALGAFEFAKPEIRRKHPCFVLAPQCPPGRYWVELDWRAEEAETLPAPPMTEKPSTPQALALELLDKLLAELPVDKKRIYVTGLSSGGYGSWDAIQRRPDLFAAAIPICGGGDPAQAAKLKNVAIWAFHGDQDRIVPLGRTKIMVEAVRQAGGNPKVTVYPGAGHDAWSATYANPRVLDWLFEQRK